MSLTVCSVILVSDGGTIKERHFFGFYLCEFLFIHYLYVCDMTRIS